MECVSGKSNVALKSGPWCHITQGSHKVKLEKYLQDLRTNRS